MINKLMKLKKNKKGFTLIELIVVIAILGILAAILIPQFTGFQDKAKAGQALVDAKNWATAADAYLMEHPTANTAALLNAASATITAVAGTTGTANVTGLTTDGKHVTFTYVIQLDGATGKYYAAARSASGKFGTGFNAASAAAITMAIDAAA